jgi:hypothetical protein
MQLLFPASFFCFLFALFTTGEITDKFSSNTFKLAFLVIASLHNDSFDWSNELFPWLSVCLVNFYSMPVNDLFFIWFKNVNFRQYLFVQLI